MLFTLICCMFSPKNHPSLVQVWRRRSAVLAVCVTLGVWLIAGFGDGLSQAAKAPDQAKQGKPKQGTEKAKTKPKVKGKPPDLKILSVDPAPVPFVPDETSLTMTIMVELPKTVPEGAVLDVTTLITSPSKLSIRLLSDRQLLPDRPAEGEKNSEASLVEVVQTWDGTDHTKRLVPAGTYEYQVQAKLMVIGKNGPLTRKTSWKKKGSFEVRVR
ncbi:MAG TPA: hypothetical protein VI337_05830 [Nitrospirales bacterium]|nr:hypothetical protein [Nitrospirales bacterium]